MKYSFMLFLLAILLPIAQVQAQIPVGFNYQAVLRDNNGDILSNNQAYFRISIKQSSWPFTTAYEGFYYTTTNEYGLVNLVIGQEDEINETYGTFASIDWIYSTGWVMKVEVDTGGGSYIDMGTQQILTVPFAIHSNTASYATDMVLNDLANVNTSDLNGGEVLQYDANEDEWSGVPFGGGGWGLNGNAGLMDGTNFIGTTSNVPLTFKQNNIVIGRLDATKNNVFLGDLTGGGLETSNNTMIGDHAGYSHFGVGIGNNTFIGSNAGYSNTIATENTYVGSHAGYSNVLSTGNTMVGRHAGNANTAGNNTFIGHNAGALNTSGSENVFVGKDAALLSTTGTRNTFIGNNTGRNNTTGSENVFVGLDAGKLNTTGNDNVFAGVEAGYVNTTGENNVFVGRSAGKANVLGYNNVLIGLSAGIANTSGSDNVSIGRNAGDNCATCSDNVSIGENAGFWGSQNVILGLNAGQSNQGSNNVMIGQLAGATNVWDNNIYIGALCGAQSFGGTENTFIGYRAGYYSDASANTFLGFNSGYLNSSGSSNTFLGTRTGENNDSGKWNTFVGSGSGTKNTSGNGNAFFGMDCGGNNSSGDDNSFFGFQSGNDNTSGTGNTMVGESAGSNNTNGNSNTFVGKYSGTINENGTGNTCIGDNSNVDDVDFDGATAIGFFAVATSSDQVVLGASTVQSIGGYEDWSNLSDGRYKTDVKESQIGLDFILDLKPVSYHLDINKINTHLFRNNPQALAGLNPEAIASKEEILYSGFVAQEVEESARKLGIEFSGIDKPSNANDAYGLRYGTFVVPLVKAVQEQQQQIESLRNENEQLRTMMRELQSFVEMNIPVQKK